MKTYKSFFTLLLLLVSMAAFADASADASPASKKRYNGRRWTGNMQRYTGLHSTSSSDGWGIGASMNYLFSDFEYMGILASITPELKPAKGQFGGLLKYQLGGGIHVSYNMQRSQIIDFRATLSLNLLRGTHYPYQASRPGGDTDMSMSDVMSYGLGIHDGVEIYPDRRKMGLYFYAGGAVMTSLQSLYIGGSGERRKNKTHFLAVGLAPMADLGIGYKFDLNGGGAIRLDLMYSQSFLDYPCSEAVSGGKVGFNSTLDGYPGKYVKGVNEAGEKIYYNMGPRDPQSGSSFWVKPVLDVNGEELRKMFHWPDGYLSFRFSIVLPAFQPGDNHRVRM